MITPTQRLSAFVLLLAAPVVLPVAGCGGGQSGSSVSAPVSTGRAVIRIAWPEPSQTATRLIPAATGSIRVRFLRGTTEVRTALLTRTADTTYSRAELDLPPGGLTVRVDAFPTLDGTGNAVATAQVPITIVAGQRTPVNLTLASTIARVDITPEEIPFSIEPVLISAVAYDAQNQVIVTGQWQWSVAPAGIVTLTPSGSTATIQAQAEGTAVITLRESESGRTFNKTIVVLPPPDLSG